MYRLLCVLALLFMVSGHLLANDEVYRWTDEDGTTHFTAQPPQDGRDYQVISMSAGNLGRAAPVGGEEETEPESEPRSEFRPGRVERPEPEPPQPDPEEVAAACRQAAEQLFVLEEERQVIVRDDDGEEVLLEDDDRVRMLEETRQFIAQNC